MSQGTVTLEGNTWVIDARPHIMTRLRRLFAAAKPAGDIRLTATDDVCRDLEWVCERYDLDVSDRDLLAERAERHRLTQKACDDLLAGRVDPRQFDLALPPRGYQRIAADMALRTGGLLVADEVGLGKTITAICMLTDPRVRPALVVTLTHLPRQWEEQIHRFAPGMAVHVVRKSTPYDVTGAPRKADQPELFERRLPDVLIVNYHKLAGWTDHLRGVVRGVVFDEIQELRRTESAKYAAARAIVDRAAFVMGLSATPIYNYGGEIHAVLDCIRPGALGDWDEFNRDWCGWGDRRTARVKEPAAFGAWAREQGLMIRRTRRDVGRELPSLQVVPHQVEADEKALNRIRGDAAELARVIMARESGWQERGQASREFDVRIRQATGIAKAPYVAEFVRLLVESGEKVVLYGWHREVYALWADALRDVGVVFYTGTESTPQKAQAASAFVEGDAQVLVMSLRSGAGLDGLQSACRTVVFGELDWSPGVHHQCIGRVHRDGQLEPVVAYYLLADSGSDPIVSDVLGVKRRQAEGINDPDAPAVEVVDDAGKGDAIRRLAASFLERRTKGAA